MIPETPLFLLSKIEPEINWFTPYFEQIRQNPKEEVRFIIENSQIENKGVGPYQAFLLALQHNPDLIENLIFGLEFSFEKPGHSRERYKGYEWISKDTIQWFYQLSESFPAAVYFLSDRDARIFALMGDLITAGKVKMAPARMNLSHAFLNEEQMNILGLRLFNHSCFLCTYCHGSGFNPKQYIESIIADFNLQFTFDDVWESYLENIRNNGFFFVTRK